MTWARRLKRVCMRHIRVPHPCGVACGYANRLSCRFVGIDVQSCVRCGGAASIEEPALIERILAHVRRKEAAADRARGPPSTGPPARA